MQHSNKFNNNKIWKPLLVLPLLVIFLMSFNTKAESHEKDIASKTLGLEDVVIITKDFSKADFERVKENLSKQGITIKFKGIKRNDAGEITAIKIEASNKKSEVKYTSEDDDAINPITIKFDHNNISIGDKGELHFGHAYKIRSEKHKDGNVFIFSDDDGDEDVEIIIQDGKKHKIRTSGNAFYKIHTDDDHDGEHEVIIIEGKAGDKKIEKIITSKTGKKLKIKTIDSDANVWSTDEDVIVKKLGKGNFVYISSDDGKDPLILVDGKEISKDDMDKLNPKDIETVEVLKGDSATEKYGEKGKNGVILITTKKE